MRQDRRRFHPIAFGLSHLVKEAAADGVDFICQLGFILGTPTCLALSSLSALHHLQAASMSALHFFRPG